MKFRIEVPTLNHAKLVNHQTKIITLGSCFAESIGGRLADHQFDIELNPFGILFNPKSILNVLNTSALESRHLVELESGVASFDFHSKYRANSLSDYKTMYESTIKIFEKSLKIIDILFLTFGTAWAYRFKETNKIIANCQKQKSKLFDKMMLDLDSLKIEYHSTLTRLIKDNPKLKIVLTVSPIRHIKDGIVENNRSKAALLLLTDYLVQSFPNNLIYYPSYEIQMDDLRDYRFYEKDLVHPNPVAIDYIYEHFQKSFCTKAVIDDILVIEKYNRLLNHHFLFASKDQKADHAIKVKIMKQEVKSILDKS